MWPWLVRTPIEDLTDVTLAIEDIYGDDVGGHDDDDDETTIRRMMIIMAIIRNDLVWKNHQVIKVYL